MKFERRRKLHFWVNSGYFSCCSFNIIENFLSKEEIIIAFMKTNFYLWQEKRDLIWKNKGKGTVTKTNTHGLYDASLLTINDYVRADFNTFREHFVNAIKKEGGDSILKLPEYFEYHEGVRRNLSTQQESIDSIDYFSSVKNNYYILTAPDNKKHPMSVYDFFYSGFVVDTEKRIITLIEHGMD